MNISTSTWLQDRTLLDTIRQNLDAVEVTCSDGTFTADYIRDVGDRYWRNPGSLDPSYDYVQFANINDTGEDYQVRIRDISTIKILNY